MRLGGPPSQSGRGGEEKNSRTLLGLEPIAQRSTTELFVPKLKINQDYLECNRALHVQSIILLVGRRKVTFQVSHILKLIPSNFEVRCMASPLVTGSCVKTRFTT